MEQTPKYIFVLLLRIVIPRSEECIMCPVSQHTHHDAHTIVITV